MEIMHSTSTLHNGTFHNSNFFIEIFSIDTSDTTVVKEVDNSVGFSFNVIFATTLFQLEAAHPMTCTVNDMFTANSSSNFDNEVQKTLRYSFEFSSQDIRLVSNKGLILMVFIIWFLYYGLYYGFKLEP